MILHSLDSKQLLVMIVIIQEVLEQDLVSKVLFFNFRELGIIVAILDLGRQNGTRGKIGLTWPSGYNLAAASYWAHLEMHAL